MEEGGVFSRFSGLLLLRLLRWTVTTPGVGELRHAMGGFLGGPVEVVT